MVQIPEDHCVQFNQQPVTLAVARECASGFVRFLSLQDNGSAEIASQEAGHSVGIMFAKYQEYLLIHDLMDMGLFAFSNQTIKPEVATALCKKYGSTLVLTS
jgi:hypothetical protein